MEAWISIAHVVALHRVNRWFWWVDDPSARSLLCPDQAHCTLYIFRRRKAFLQWLLEAAFEGLTKEGWLKLSRNWGVFFLFLAVLNEVLRHYLSFGDWLATKIWVFMPLSFLFTFTQLPMLLKHGLSVGDEDEVVKNPPTE